MLAAENAFVVNVFNLSDQPRRIEGSLPAAQLGIDPNRWYARRAAVEVLRASLRVAPKRRGVCFGLRPTASQAVGQQVHFSSPSEGL